jgi:hypothetical protein
MSGRVGAKVRFDRPDDVGDPQSRRIRGLSTGHSWPLDRTFPASRPDVPGHSSLPRTRIGGGRRATSGVGSRACGIRGTRLVLRLPGPDKSRLGLLHATEFRRADRRTHRRCSPDAVPQDAAGDLLASSPSSRPGTTYRSLTLTLNDTLRHGSHLGLDIHDPSPSKRVREHVPVQRRRTEGQTPWSCGHDAPRSTRAPRPLQGTGRAV